MSEAAEYWDAQAPSFDEAADHGLRDPEVRAAWRSLLLPLLPPAPARVADLGCGTGSLSVLLAEFGHRVVGLDFARAMIERARTKASDARLDIEFVVGDAAQPPWPGRTFDVVLSRHLLWALSDPLLGLNDWIRVLRPTGRLVLIEGRWWTGAGMTAASVIELLSACGRPASVTPLSEPELWGEKIDDERYLVLSPPVDAAGD